MGGRAAAGALWLSSPNTALLELGAAHGVRRVVLDLEHGVFDPAELDRFVPLCNALGIEVYAKVLGPEAVPIQQALDFGACAVIVPHIQDAGHARRVAAHAKYPPLGDRSFAGGRIVGYGGTPSGFFARENARIRCLPMIESAAALRDVQQILQLPTVDGVFVGPTDLALSCGRSEYAFGHEDRVALERIAAAAAAAGKPWVMPTWSAGERALARALGAAWCVSIDEHGVLGAGLDRLLAEIAAESAPLPAAQEPRA